MKRGKGICAAILMGLCGGMTATVVAASADAGGRDQAASGPAAAVVAHATPAGQSSDPGNTRGAGGGGGGGGGSDNGPGVGASSGGGDNSGRGSSSSGGGSGARSGAQGSSGGGAPQGSMGGRTGTAAPASGSTGNGSERGQGGGGGGSGRSSGGSQGQSSGAAPGRGSGSNGGGSGSSGGNGGNHLGGQNGRCNSSCHVGQQPQTGTPTFIPSPTQTPTTSSTPTQTTPTPVPTPRPVTTPKPGHGLPSTTYSTSASPLLTAQHAATPALAGVGGTVSPTARSGQLANGSPLPVGTPSSISTLLGSAPTAPASTRSGPRRGQGGSPQPVVVTQPIAQHTIIQSIEQVVPPEIWLALAAALAFGGLSAGWALYSSHRVRRQANAFAAMSTAALTDQLTGVLNRRGFLEAVERELARARRYERGFVLAYVDVRGLKGVNDTEGHRAGDELLKEAASLLQDSARADDVVGRLGGDEMGLLLIEQGVDGAGAVRRRVENQVPIRREKLGLHSPWDLTIGTAAFPDDGETVDDLLRVADERLYEQRGIDLLQRTADVPA